MTEGSGRRVVARNRKARHEFLIMDEFEAGLVLHGPEVKSLRAGNVAFRDAFARVDGGEVWLHDLHIAPYEQATRYDQPPDRTRKLLLKRGEIRKLAQQVDQKGHTLIPLEIYFRRGVAKLTLAVARGKKLHDKRETLKQRAQEREAARALRGSE